MQKERRIVIIGAGNVGLSKAIDKASKQNTVCVVKNVFNTQLTNPKKEEIYIISKRAELPKMLKYPKEPVFNAHKHNQSCNKNRKKRKKLKRR